MTSTSGNHEPVVQAQGLRKRYGDVEALRGISLEIKKGEVFGLLGPNGAGKTTTIEILEGLR
ncbi:MAG: ATP-binding cassette domain-containing protein, partial [Terriglobia bacterium]